jgi:uncharacterized integral membrane protein (TIGR00698 family)
MTTLSERAAPKTSVLPGLGLSALVAGAALLLAELPLFKETLHVGALLLVILLGMGLATAGLVPPAALPGVRAAQRPILRLAVAGLGFRLGVAEVWEIGAPALIVVAVSTIAALAFGWWLARRLGVGENLAILMGVGGAICGASAVVAADSVVQAERRDAALALAVITALGAVGIVAYPVLYHASGMSELVYGVWDGASLHEMAHVVAAGFGVSDEAARVATVVKLARICLLAPVVLYLAWTTGRSRAAAGRPRVAPVPWFLGLFLVCAGINSSGILGPETTAAAVGLDLALLCWGMAGVGLTTGFRDLGSAGLRPIAAAAAQWVFLAALALVLALALVG